MTECINLFSSLTDKHEHNITANTEITWAFAHNQTKLSTTNQYETRENKGKWN